MMENETAPATLRQSVQRPLTRGLRRVSGAGAQQLVTE